MKEGPLKLYAFETAAETDWIAANTDEEARIAYMGHYGLSERDMDGVDISEVDPESVELYPDDWTMTTTRLSRRRQPRSWPR